MCACIDTCMHVHTPTLLRKHTSLERPFVCMHECVHVYAHPHIAKHTSGLGSCLHRGQCTEGWLSLFPLICQHLGQRPEGLLNE